MFNWLTRVRQKLANKLLTKGQQIPVVSSQLLVFVGCCCYLSHYIIELAQLNNCLVQTCLVLSASFKDWPISHYLLLLPYKLVKATLTWPRCFFPHTTNGLVLGQHNSTSPGCYPTPFSPICKYACMLAQARIRCLKLLEFLVNWIELVSWGKRMHKVMFL